jgi:hypothetical protein
MRSFLEKNRLLPVARRIRAITKNLHITKQIPLKDQSHFLLSGSDQSLVKDLENKDFSVIGAYAFLTILDFQIIHILSNPMA